MQQRKKKAENLQAKLQKEEKGMDIRKLKERRKSNKKQDKTAEKTEKKKDLRNCTLAYTFLSDVVIVFKLRVCSCQDFSPRLHLSVTFPLISKV